MKIKTYEVYILDTFTGGDDTLEFEATSANDALKQARHHMRVRVGHTRFDGKLLYRAKVKREDAL